MGSSAAVKIASFKLNKNQFAIFEEFYKVYGFAQLA